MIGRDHLDSGSVASPYRETEGMMDGSDAIADWPILNALLGVSSGAAWVAVHHGGGVGIGRSIHSGVQVVADGTDEGALRARARAHERPGHGRDAARRRGLRAGARDGARARPRPAHAAVSRTLLVPDLVLEPGGAVRAGVAVELDGGRDRRASSTRPARGSGPTSSACPAACSSRASSTGIRTPSSAICAAASRCATPAAPEDDFWSWREAMYAAAEALDPRGMRAVAEECFDAGRRAGYTAVGEFHYVHHRPDGTPYEEPNELALAVIDGGARRRACASCC